MPPRSVCLNVFTTSRGLGKPVHEESVKEVQVHVEEENGNLVAGKEKDSNGEGKDTMHGKHDSMQSSPDDTVASYNCFTTSSLPAAVGAVASDNISPLTLTPGSTDLAASTKHVTSDEPVASTESAPASKKFKLALSCLNCGYAPETADVTLKQCSRCKTAVYCSPKCQKSDWPAHKKACAATIPKKVLAPTVTENAAWNDVKNVQNESEVAEFSPNVSGASTPISPSEDGTTSTAATSPGLYFEYKTELLNSPSVSNASASIPTA